MKAKYNSTTSFISPKSMLPGNRHEPHLQTHTHTHARTHARTHAHIHTHTYLPQPPRALKPAVDIRSMKNSEDVEVGDPMSS